MVTPETLLLNLISKVIYIQSAVYPGIEGPSGHVVYGYFLFLGYPTLRVRRTEPP